MSNTWELAITEMNNEEQIINEVNEEIKEESGYEIFDKVVKIINYVWENFSTLLGWELCEIKFKLGGYKYYLADFIGELQRRNKMYLIEYDKNKIEWILEKTGKVREENGKVSIVERDEIKDQVVISLMNTRIKQTIYENNYYIYKTKMSSLDDIIWAITQRISDLKRHIESWT